MADGAKKVGGGVKKVGGGASAGGKPEKEKRAKRVAYDPKTAARNELDKEGKLTVSRPVNWDPIKHKPIKKKDFAMSANHMGHTADIIEQKGKDLIEKAGKMKIKADRMSKMGDEKTQKTVKRAEKVFKQLSELKASLAEAGIDINEILKEQDEAAAKE